MCGIRVCGAQVSYDAGAGKLEVTYSYWDGSGHRRTLRLVKGDTIANFLTEVQRSLGAEFPELRGMRPDSLVCVRPALILFPSLFFVNSMTE